MISDNINEQSKGINRTICIGLGGTGRDVLMRIRRLIVDREKDLTNLPIVSFIHIDTDKAATQVTGIRTGSMYRGVDLSFRESEKVNATMTSNEVTMFVQGLERRSEYTRHGPYDHIGMWFPPQLVRNIKAVEEGAKGIRPVGRLAFFHNYQKIKTAIETAEKRTRGHEALLLQKGLKVEAGINIFVIGSLCGGTGSGMFLDVAYALRHLYGSQSAQIVGYLIISPELYGNTPGMSANTYAALKELDYYSSPGTKFNAVYDIQNLVVVEEQRPPFDYSYLVSHQTGGEYQILTQGKLCNVIAHKIALDFSGELAPVVKGNRDNFLQHMIQSDKHPRPNVQRYLTFGLAAIYFPRDRIVRIALTRVGSRLVKFWLNGQGQSPDPLTLKEQFLIQFHWHDDPAKKDGISNKLGESVQENNKTFSNTIISWRNNLERLIGECKNRDDRQALYQQIPRQIREQFRKIQPGEAENSRGIWLTRVQQNSPNLAKEFKSNISDFLIRLLSPSEPNFSIKNARDWLDALQHELHSYELNLIEEITNLSGHKRLEDIEKKWRDTESIVGEIEQKPGFISFNKNNQIQAEVKVFIREICELIKHNFDLVVLQESLKIVYELQQFIEDQVTSIGVFNSIFEDLQTAYDKQEQELRQLNFDEMSGEAIFDDDDIDKCYQALLPENDLRRQLVLVSAEVTDTTGQGNSLVSLVNRERVPLYQLQKEIELKINEFFQSRNIDIANSVVKRFLDKYSLTKRSTRLRQIMDEAEALLYINKSEPYFRDDPAKSSKLIGFKDTDETEVKTFKSLLYQDLGISSSILKATQADDEILIVNEYAGFPLRLIESLKNMRNPYLREANSSTSYLHNDSRAFYPDIIPPDALTIEKIEDVFYPCLAFELLQQTSDAGELEFQYYDSLRDAWNPAILSGEWSKALEELANNQQMSQELQQLLDNEISQIERQIELWESKYLPKLRKFVNQVDELPEESPNYPYKLAVVGSSTTNDPMVKEGIIIRFLNKMDRKIKTLRNVDFSSTDNSAKNKILASQLTPESPVNSEEIVIEYSDKFDGDTFDNRKKRREELELLKQDLNDGFMSEEEYEREKQKIFRKYPL
jgi:hypothetical protein